jgi:hypothetical protein
MDAIYVQTVWQIMEELRKANQLESALSGCLDILCKTTSSPKGTIWMMDDQSGRVVAVIASGTSDSTGVPGFNESPDFMPRERIF